MILIEERDEGRGERDNDGCEHWEESTTMREVEVEKTKFLRLGFPSRLGSLICSVLGLKILNYKDGEH